MGHSGGRWVMVGDGVGRIIVGCSSSLLPSLYHISYFPSSLTISFPDSHPLY